MTVLLNNVDTDTIGNFIDGDGSERTIHVTADDFGGGTVTLELAEMTPSSIPVTASDLSAIPQNVTSNLTFLIEKISVGLSIRARLDGSTGASNVRVLLL